MPKEITLGYGRNEEAAALYKSGLGVATIAEYFSVTPQWMYKLLKKFEVKLRSDAKEYAPEIKSWPRAHQLVQEAVRKKILVPKSCEICGLGPRDDNGRSLIHAHHDDYNKPLEVRWLCHLHHAQWHKHNKAVPLTKPYPDRRRKPQKLVGASPVIEHDLATAKQVLKQKGQSHG